MARKSLDVVIVGAGAAGLSAAAALNRAGLRTVILEARDRIGGRIHTQRPRSVPVPVEFGAEFVHGKPPELWDLVRRESFPVAEAEGDNFCFNRGKLNKCNDFWDHWEQVSRSMRRQNGRDESFLSFLNRLKTRQTLPAEIYRHAVEFVEGFNAADASQISLQSLIQDRDASAKVEGDRLFHLINGYDRIFESLGPAARGLSLDDGKRSPLEDGSRQNPCGARLLRKFAGIRSESGIDHVAAWSSAHPGSSQFRPFRSGTDTDFASSESPENGKCR